MLFETRHKIFLHTTEFTEDKPPAWITQSDLKWWFDKYVLTLEVGESIETDFQRITRKE
jgi:hypothetical protein